MKTGFRWVSGDSGACLWGAPTGQWPAGSPRYRTLAQPKIRLICGQPDLWTEFPVLGHAIHAQACSIGGGTLGRMGQAMVTSAHSPGRRPFRPSPSPTDTRERRISSSTGIDHVGQTRHDLSSGTPITHRADVPKRKNVYYRAMWSLVSAGRASGSRTIRERVSQPCTFASGSHLLLNYTCYGIFRVRRNVRH